MIQVWSILTWKNQPAKSHTCVKNCPVHMRCRDFPFVENKENCKERERGKSTSCKERNFISRWNPRKETSEYRTHTDWQMISDCQERCRNTTAVRDSQHRWWQQRKRSSSTILPPSSLTPLCIWTYKHIWENEWQRALLDQCSKSCPSAVGKDTFWYWIFMLEQLDTVCHCQQAKIETYYYFFFKYINLHKSMRGALIISPQACPPSPWWEVVEGSSRCSSSTSSRLMFQHRVYPCTFCTDKREQITGQECISRVIGLCAGKI